MWRVLVGVICFFPLSAHAAQREYVSAWFVDSLIKVFPDTPAATSKLEPTLISARNGHASLQVALRSESNRQLMLHVTAPRLLNGALSVQIYRVADVNVKSHPAETSLDEVVRSEVGPYPDPLFPLGKEISLEEKHYPQLKSDPDRYWRILENIGRTMAEYKQNVVFVPVRTLAKAYLADGVIKYDFGLLDRWIETFDKAGTARMIEGGHLSGRLGGGFDAPYAISTDLVENGQVVRKDLLADDPRAEKNLREFLPQLRSHLQQRGWLRRYVQHVHDEPHGPEMPIYRRFVHVVSEELPGVPTLDAIRDRKSVV